MPRQPFYGHAIARCLVSEYLLKYFPYEDFVIYEIGAGNGTLALNILDYIRDEHPDVYERTRYTIVEISANLVKAQKKKLNGVHPCVKVINQSVFRWGKREPAPCFFLAMEVVVSLSLGDYAYCLSICRTILLMTLFAMTWRRYSLIKASLLSTKREIWICYTLP